MRSSFHGILVVFFPGSSAPEDGYLPRVSRPISVVKQLGGSDSAKPRRSSKVLHTWAGRRWAVISRLVRRFT